MDMIQRHDNDRQPLRTKEKSKARDGTPSRQVIVRNQIQERIYTDVEEVESRYESGVMA